MEGTIYAFRNKINGKYYVGQTTDVRRRRSKHFRAASGCWLFNRAMRKYGRDAFEFIILESGIQSREELNTLEMKYIAETKAYPEGYNLTPGGHEHGEEQDKMISHSTKNRWAAMTEEKRRAISEKCSAKAKAQWSNEETRKIMAQANKTKKKRPTKMTAIKADKIFLSINSLIKRAHRKAEIEAENVRKSNSPIAQEMIKRAKGRKVYCRELDKIFDSAYKAAEATGCRREYIAQMVSGRKYYNLPYTFEYAS